MKKITNSFLLIVFIMGTAHASENIDSRCNEKDGMLSDNGALARPKMVEIPSGLLVRHADSIDFKVSKFLLSETEISVLQWNEVCEWANRNGYDLMPAKGKDDLPVTRVNWYDVVKWCNALSEWSGEKAVYYETPVKKTVYRKGISNIRNGCIDQKADGFRLPTSVEWEYAFYAGKEYPFDENGSISIGHNNNYAYGWLKDHFLRKKEIPEPQSVASKKKNEYGLYNMLGNVWEWCQDRDGWYLTLSKEPLGYDKGDVRILCGGSVETRMNHASLITRRYYPTNKSPVIGFRVAMTGKP